MPRIVCRGGKIIRIATIVIWINGSHEEILCQHVIVGPRGYSPTLRLPLLPGDGVENVPLLNAELAAAAAQPPDPQQSSIGGELVAAAYPAGPLPLTAIPGRPLSAVSPAPQRTLER